MCHWDLQVRLLSSALSLESDLIVLADTTETKIVHDHPTTIATGSFCIRRIANLVCSPLHAASNEPRRSLCRPRIASLLLSDLVVTACPGAIFGVGGALAVFCYRHKEFFGQGGDAVLRSLGQNLAMNVVYGLLVPNIDNW